MKKFGLAIVAALVLMFSMTAYATNDTKNMINQVSNFSSSWRPIIGKSLYLIHRDDKDVAVMCFYELNGDPEVDTIQVVFVKTKGTYKLFAIVFSSIDRVLENIDVLLLPAYSHTREE
jgi:hypothetical protein